MRFTNSVVTVCGWVTFLFFLIFFRAGIPSGTENDFSGKLG